MTDESDGIGEAFDGQIRIALAVAMQMAQRFSRLREELARSAQARTEQQTHELQVRFDAERNAARASLAPVQQSEWWNTASVADIATAYETAEGWRPVDPEMAGTADRMREELRSRYGIDVENLGADPAAVRDAVTRAEQARAEAAEQRNESTLDRTEAGTLLAASEQLDRSADHETARAREERESRERSSEFVGEQNEADPTNPWVQLDDGRAANVKVEEERERRGLDNRADAARTANDGTKLYDSAERRDSFASDMEKAGVGAELQKTRLTADLDNGTHPSAAVTQKAARQQKRRGAGQKPGMQRERGGLSQ
jgi:hypothetical protein